MVFRVDPKLEHFLGQAWAQPEDLEISKLKTEAIGALRNSILFEQGCWFSRFGKFQSYENPKQKF